MQNEHAADSGIVYVRTRKRADAIAEWLQERGFKALSYHAGLDTATRARHQQRFLQEETVIMVATIAFGMGIDKPDVRFVAHLDMPASVEAYYQETGRAGRDGQPADAWMIYTLGDVVAMRKMQELSEGDADFKRIQLKKLESLLGYCETVTCRRQVLLNYFGESSPNPCGNCDTCLEPLETWDGTEAAQMALSCVYRTGQRFGAAYLTDVLRGQPTERIQRFGHDRIKTFGVGHAIDAVQWRSVFRQLMAAGLLSVNLSEISGFRLTEASWPVLKGEKTIAFRNDPHLVKASRKRTPAADGARPEHLPDASVPLWDKLRRLRLAIAKELNVPPFVVFHDRTLAEMVTQRPVTHSDLLRIHGVGENKARKFGQQFLEVLNEENIEY
jgi:ATP-dependent DNA helicase RecQ